MSTFLYFFFVSEQRDSVKAHEIIPYAKVNLKEGVADPDCWTKIIGNKLVILEQIKK